MQQCRVQKNVAEQKLCIWALPWHQPLLMIDFNSFGIDRTILANPETITADVITDASLFLVSKPNANVNGLAIDCGDSWDADF